MTEPSAQEPSGCSKRPRWTHEVGSGCIVGALIIVVAYLGLPLGYVAYRQLRWPYLKPRIEESLQPLDPLIAALERFKADYHGQYPSQLSFLVPRYLSALPAPSPPFADDVRYSLVDGDAADVFQLVLSVPQEYHRQWLQFDRIVYLSGERYPPEWQGYALADRIGRWAYYVD